MDRKKLLRIQLFLWIGVVIFLTGVLGIALLKGGLEVSEVGAMGKYTEEYIITTESVQRIDINLISEDVEVYGTEGDTFKIVQNSNYRIKEKDKLLVEENGNTIKITKSFKNRVKFGSWNRRELTQIYVPKSFQGKIEGGTVSGELSMSNLVVKEVVAKTTSGEIELKDIQCKRIIVGSTSGDCQLEGLSANEVEVNTTSGEIGIDIVGEKIIAKSVSGDIFVDGNYRDVEAKTTSGEIEIGSSSIMDQVDLTTVSGDMLIRIPQDSGFELDFRAVSGTPTGDMIKGKYEKGEVYTYGDGYTQIDTRTTSGDVDMRWY